MKRADLISKLSTLTESTKKAAEEFLEAFIKTVTNGLAAGEDVTLPGIGTFKVKATAARVGRNPATGDPVNIPAGKKVSFKIHKSLKEAIA